MKTEPKEDYLKSIRVLKESKDKQEKLSGDLRDIENEVLQNCRSAHFQLKKVLAVGQIWKDADGNRLMVLGLKGNIISVLESDSDFNSNLGIQSCVQGLSKYSIGDIDDQVAVDFDLFGIFKEYVCQDLCIVNYFLNPPIAATEKGSPDPDDDDDDDEAEEQKSKPRKPKKLKRVVDEDEDEDEEEEENDDDDDDDDDDDEEEDEDSTLAYPNRF